MYPPDSIFAGIRGAQSDIGALAAKDQKAAPVMVWNYHDGDEPGSSEKVT